MKKETGSFLGPSFAGIILIRSAGIFSAIWPLILKIMAGRTPV
jgi:hypothetical protein